MSYEYDKYISEHITNVRRAFLWINSNLPEIIENYGETRAHIMDHDRSKYDKEEYDAYDRYFYGGNRSYAVVRNFNLAWLHHIHNNPHHWQHWVLINDDEKEGFKALDIPNSYIIEMICDWWSFSWTKGNLFEIFDWYDSHKNYMMLSEKTRRFVESYLGKIKGKLNEDNTLQHHGIKGQKWGVKNGPPYPLDKSRDSGLKNAIEQPIIKADHITLEGPPNAIVERTNKNGGVDRNYYDKDGKQTKQISNNDHGKPKHHDYGEHGEHAHDYVYDEEGNLIEKTTRELSDEERKENDDIL